MLPSAEGMALIFKPHQPGFVGLANETKIFDCGTLNLCFALCSGTIGVVFPGGVPLVFKPHQLGLATCLQVGLANETEIFDRGTLNLCFVLCSGTFGVAYPALNVSVLSNKFDFEQETLWVFLAALRPSLK